MAQLLALVGAPLLTRLYSPEDFGALNIFISLASVISVILCLRYEMAIALPERDDEAARLFWGSLGIAVIISILSVPFVFLCKDKLWQTTNMRGQSFYLWLLPISLLFGGVLFGHPSLNYWAIRLRHFGKLATSKVVSTASTLLLQVGAAVAGFASGESLIVATTIGGAISAVVLGIQVWKENGAFLVRNFNVRQILEGLSRYRKFPLYDSWAILINNASWLLPIFILPRYFSLTEVGLYGLTNRVLAIPMTLAGGAIAQVSFQRASLAKTDGSLAIVVHDVLQHLIAWGMLPMMLIAMIAPSSFRLIFGLKWAEAGVYAQILSGWIFIWFVSSPLSTMYSVLEKQDHFLLVNIAIFTTRFGALVGGGLLGSARWALILFSISGIIIYGFQILMITAACGIQPSTIVQLIIKYFLRCIPAGGILLAAIQLRADGRIQIALAGILLTVYMYFEANNDPQLRSWLHPSKSACR